MSTLHTILSYFRHDKINIHPKNKPEWFMSKNPCGTVPCLELNGKCLWESHIIMDYLDDAYPDNQLHPKDAFMKARQRIMMEGAQIHVNIFKEIITNFLKMSW